MMRAFLYDARGEDQEIELKDTFPKLQKHQLVWIDLNGREPDELKRLQDLLGLDARTLHHVKEQSRSTILSNYGEYIQFGVQCFAVKDLSEITVPRVPALHRLDFIIGKEWLLTIHDQDVFFLDEFRKQDRGETLIGSLTPASLAAALLDWHLVVFLEVMTKFEAFVDGLDVRMLGRKTIRDNLLAQVMAGRRFISSMRRTLSPQRAIFYGLSRPDFLLVADASAALHFSSLERRFERTLDTVEHGRELIQSSFELFTTRIAESTNVLVRRLTIVGAMLGTIGATAGIFGMNFDLPFNNTGVLGFWIVLIGMAAVVGTAAILAWFKGWF